MQRLSREAGLVAGSLGLTFLLLCLWSWGKWADAQIDFGYELYLPWQMGEGRALYRDLAYRNGPFSPYFNRLCFQILGVSIRSLVVCNLLILAGICALAYRLLVASCGRLAAASACWVFLCVFAFGQYVSIGNYNYVTPYQHPQTHGLALSLLMLAGLVEVLRRGSPAWAGLAGACLGAVFLTKAELFVPAGIAAAAGLALWLLEGGADRRNRWKSIAFFAACALLPVSLFCVILISRMPLDLATAGILGNWMYLWEGIEADSFYRGGLGADDVLGNGLKSLGYSLAIALFAGLLELARAWDSGFWQRKGLAAGLGVVVFAALVAGGVRVAWVDLPRALPIFSLVVTALLLVRVVGARNDRAEFLRLAPLALWGVYSFFLLGKMILNVRVYHYGFVLAMPATLLLVVVLVRGRDILHRRQTSRYLAPALALAVIGAGVLFYLGVSDRYHARRHLTIGSGADELVLSDAKLQPQNPEIVRLLERLESLMPAEASLLVLPEGSGLNYWLRRPNPSRFSLFIPSEFDAVGGDGVMLEDLGARPPDFIVLWPRDLREFQRGDFGEREGNGRAILDWVRETYEELPADQWRSLPSWPIEIFVRRPGAD